MVSLALPKSQNYESINMKKDIKNAKSMNQNRCPMGAGIRLAPQ